MFPIKEKNRSARVMALHWHSLHRIRAFLVEYPALLRKTDGPNYVQKLTYVGYFLVQRGRAIALDALERHIEGTW